MIYPSALAHAFASSRTLSYLSPVFKHDPDCAPFLQFADQFKEVKEAARLAREKSQERFELANPGLNIAAPEVTF